MLTKASDNKYSEAWKGFDLCLFKQTNLLFEQLYFKNSFVSDLIKGPPGWTVFGIFNMFLKEN